MTKKLDLTGKTSQDVRKFFDKVVNDKIKEFTQDNKVIDYNTIYDFINNLDGNTLDLIQPVTKLSFDELPDDLSMGEAKKLIKQNSDALKLYKNYKYYDLNSNIISILMDEFVRQSFPAMKLTDKQINALTSAAYEEGHSAGYLEVLSYLDDYINMTKEFMSLD